MPAFMDPGRPVGVVDLNLGKLPGQSPSNSMSGGQRLGQKGSLRYTSGLGGENAIDWVMDCLRFTAETVANADYHFEKELTAQEEADYIATKKPGQPVAAPDPLRRLLAKPNPYMDYVELMELLVIDLLLTGNAYWMKWRTNEKGQPLAVYRLAPPYVEVGTKPWGIGSYIYQIPNADKLEVEPQEILHFKLANPDPTNPFYGCGLMQGAGRAADLELALTDSQASYFENHALPSVAVETDRRVPRDVFKKLKAQMRNRMQGPKNAGELMILEAGLKLSPISTSAGEAQFMELAKMSRDRCFAWFRMSPRLLGIADENGGADKLSDLQRQFDERTARPLMNKLQTKISEELVAAWDLRYVLDYEYQMPPEERANLGGIFSKLPGITVDEARNFSGLGPHPDPEIGKMTLNLPGENAGTGQLGDKSTRAGFPDPGLPGEAGRPPNWENTKPFPKPGQPLPAKAAAVKALDAVESLDDVLERLSQIEQKAETDSAEQGPIQTLERIPDTLEKVREADIDQIAEGFQGDLRKAARLLERGLLDTTEGKAFEPNSIVVKLRGSKGWGPFEDVAREAYERALLRAMSAAAIHHGKLGMKPAGEIDYEALIDDLVSRKETGVSAITKTLKTKLSDAVKKARKENATLAEIQALLQAEISDWAQEKAYDIALTEATRGYNEATIEVAEKSGFENVMVSDGKEDDGPCIDADGEIWTLQRARENPLQHPRCRRAFVPIKG